MQTLCSCRRVCKRAPRHVTWRQSRFWRQTSIQRHSEVALNHRCFSPEKKQGSGKDTDIHSLHNEEMVPSANGTGTILGVCELKRVGKKIM